MRAPHNLAHCAMSRVKRVYLSSKGTQTVEEMRIRSHEMSERVLDGLDHEKRLALAEMLTTVKKNLLNIKHDEGIA